MPLSFPNSRPVIHPTKSAVVFLGLAPDNLLIPCAVSREALRDLDRAARRQAPVDPIQSYNLHAPTIQRAASAMFDRGLGSPIHIEPADIIA